MPKTQPSTFQVHYPEPHNIRMKALLKKYPELKSLFGPNAGSAVVITLAVIIQILLAAWVSTQPWWILLLVAWMMGAVINHAMFVMIHEAAHNLIFTHSSANKFWSIIANFPIVFPAAIGFRKFHLLHHRYQGDFNQDADLAGPKEAAWVGRSTFKKIIWMLGFLYVEGVVRPNRLKNIKFMNDRWMLINIIACLGFAAVIVYFFNVKGLLYLIVSSAFAIGFHPLGARWIQEHYVVHQNQDGTYQETYSYYGPFNWVMFNVGYHNEHHDLMMVPWNKLPQLKKMAPDFYEPLYSHSSYWRLWFRFMLDPKLTLYSRVTRSSGIDIA